MMAIVVYTDSTDAVNDWWYLYGQNNTEIVYYIDMSYLRKEDEIVDEGDPNITWPVPTQAVSASIEAPLASKNKLPWIPKSLLFEIRIRGPPNAVSELQPSK